MAVAMGPGSHACLRVCIDFAQAIGAKFNIPVIPVNHIEAHLMKGIKLCEKGKFEEALKCL